MNKKWIAGFAASLTLAGLLLAQAQEGEDTVLKGGTTLVQVPVSVRDSRGDFVNGLAPIDFQLLVEGIPQSGVTLDVTSYPMSLVVVVQANSRSATALPTVIKSASLFNPIVAGETGEVALIAYDHRVQVLAPFTSDPDELKKGFLKLKAGSSPQHLDDATMEAVNMLRSRGRDRKKVIILIGETRDSGSSFNPREVLTNIEQNNVQVYTISMNHLLNLLTSKTEPNRPNATPPEQRAPLPMGNLQTPTSDAQTNFGSYVPAFTEIFAAVKGIFIPNSHEVYTKFSGGREQNFASISGLEEAVSKIGEEVHSQYLLTFAPGETAHAGYNAIEVKVLSAANYRVTARSGFWWAPNRPDAPKASGTGK